MTVRIKCFASLRQQLGVDTTEISAGDCSTVRDVWNAICNDAPPANLLCARNFSYVDFDATVSDGDEIAFFPPVTGG